MKKLTSVFVLIAVFALAAVSVGCSSTQKKSNSPEIAKSDLQPASPVDLGASSTGRGR